MVIIAEMAVLRQNQLGEYRSLHTVYGFILAGHVQCFNTAGGTIKISL